MTLRDEDELLHDPPDPTPTAWQENLFFICSDEGSHALLLCHIQRAPGRGFQEVQVVVAIDDQIASSTIEGAYRPGTLTPEITATALEPFRRWHVQLDGKGVVGAGPLGFFGTRSGDDTAIGVDLTLESTLPVADFAEGLAAMVAGLRADADGPQMGDQQHYEQGGTWRGRLRVGDREVDAHGLFVRDHSWGIRSEQQGFRAFWTASCLDGGRTFCNAIGIPRADRVLGIGVEVDESGVTFTDDVSASFAPAAGVGTYDRAEVTFGAPIERTLTAEARRHVPLYLPHSGPARYDNNAISAVRMGASTGFGVMEWASVLSDDDLAALTADRSGT